VRRLLTIAAGIAAAAAIVGIVIYGRSNASLLTRAPVAPVRAADRHAAPALDGTTLTGADISLKSFAGKPVVINFFASWCVPCRAEAPGLAKLAHEFGSRVQLVGISIDDKRPGAMAFVRHYHWNWPIVFDPNDSLAYSYGLFGKPTTVVVDQQGRIAWQHAGRISNRPIAQVLHALLRA
jgi:cytochrome c biogenesis protein CcmG, thiol:disulfide interchange protein DsbE